MGNVNVKLVCLSPEEIQERKNSGKGIVLLPDQTIKEIADQFYGGYTSGTAPMGNTPNAIILNDKDN